MPGRRSPSLVELFRAAPAKSFLLGVVPLALAAGQLLNSVVNGFSPVVALAFAVGMVGFALVATRHHAAQLRLQRLEGDLETQTGATAEVGD